MPELPEVEHLRRTLEPLLLGRRVTAVHLRRADVLRDRGLPRSGRSARLLQGAVVRRLVRHGKQLAIVAEDGRAVCVHLGMTGQVRCVSARQRLPDATHVHCVWSLVGPGQAASRLIFRDPRRFGGLWTFASPQVLHEERWSDLGPDALGISAGRLRAALHGTRRPIKASLLDQSLIAGLGNIYADEALFRAGIHPLARADTLPRERIRLLAGAIRSVLHAAIASGGSSLRDYVDANGQPGSHRRFHQVYGRAGQPCVRCGEPLDRLVAGQRTTVACRYCQRRSYKE